jgi:hypothetical protein
MPNLISPDLDLKSVDLKRTLFKNVRVGQLFLYCGRWYLRRSKLLAVYADTPGDEVERFKQKIMVKVLREDHLPPARKEVGLTFDEFINQATF